MTAHQHFHTLPREKPAIIKLRGFGYSINHLAAALGRSTSFIHAVLKTAAAYGLHKFDNRKLPRNTRCLLSRRRQNHARYWIQKWLGFILGAEEEPP